MSRGWWIVVALLALGASSPLTGACVGTGGWCEGSPPVCCPTCTAAPVEAVCTAPNNWFCELGHVTEQDCLQTGQPYCQGPELACADPRPSCCEGGCDGAALVGGTCSEGTWTCPAETVGAETCEAASQPFCLRATCTPQAAYAYSGCEYAQTPAGACPGEGTLECALGRLQSSVSSCQLAEDCEVVRLDANCLGIGRCPGHAVRGDSAQAFRESAEREVGVYCGCPGLCEREETCDLDLAAVSPSCLRGRCAYVLPGPDGCTREGGSCTSGEQCCDGAECVIPSGSAVGTCGERSDCPMPPQACSVYEPCCHGGGYTVCLEDSGDPCTDQSEACACTYLLP